MFKLSIILPVYNAKTSLFQAINSVINQTFTDWELLLVDDGSTDGSREICDFYTRKHSNIFCFHQENRGLSSARNIGIQNSQGKYIAFLDSDDWVEANYYKLMISLMDTQDVDMVLTGYTREFWHENTCKKRQRISAPEEIVDENKNFLLQSDSPFFYNFFIHVWNKLYKRETICAEHLFFDEGLRFAEDVPFNVNYYQTIRRIGIIQDCGYHYICTARESLTKKWNPGLIESNSQTYHYIKDFMKHYTSSPDFSLINNMYLRGCFLNIEKAISSGQTFSQIVHAIQETLAAPETEEILLTKISPKRCNLEFLLYRILLSAKLILPIYFSAYIRKYIKHMLGRL